MVISLSVTVVLAALVLVLCRYAGLSVLHALVCVALGFVLASSSLAPEISHIMTSLIRLL